ncbi:hypothetical protein ASPACDRAFT_48283 [Aspergillus aculeatus ATCC 16872]|uniref:Phosphatidylserine decarboxylase n=1 Tax=Aspergillus aculeatus (strain ATCC 16872 / CBS 172.66 / WB 5094) TaxID=690307 RepID=A0A1L9WF96_ASPA1|nr:uncharacterized protein ASPACDRAFT_48283 [Aspergillus aculeatus ATCC 16872]OJJ94834.1 hypothetical protein ASPACDRAFT_48283 [Aspergillus aculeatus ATCC 16872]
MTNTATITYHPVELLIRDLRDYIHRDPDRTTAFHTAINTALYPRNGGAHEMAREGIRSLDDFLCFADALLRWVPRVTTTGDELLDKSVVFYWGISRAREVVGGGGFVHACLRPAEYHRQRTPVSGRIVQVRNIQDQVYLQIAKKKEGRGLQPDRGLRRDAKEEVRRDRMPCRGPQILDAPDKTMRAVNSISSVVMTVHEGQWVRKGDEISYFQFGGLDVVMVFENPVRFREDLLPGVSCLNVREELAVLK